jgi:hypothetical protein
MLRHCCKPWRNQAGLQQQHMYMPASILFALQMQSLSSSPICTKDSAHLASCSGQAVIKNREGFAMPTDSSSALRLAAGLHRLSAGPDHSDSCSAMSHVVAQAPTTHHSGQSAGLLATLQALIRQPAATFGTIQCCSAGQAANSTAGEADPTSCLASEPACSQHHWQ